MEISKKIVTGYLFIALGLFFIQPVTAQRERHTRIDFKSFCVDFIKLYLEDFVATTAHELGHALTSYMLVGGKNDINIGISINKPGAKLFEIPKKPSRISFNSIFPVGGFASVYFSNESTLKDTIILLAGPICGALTHYFFNMYKTYQLYKKHKVNWTLTKLLKESSYSIDAISELCLNLFPWNTNDGTNILRKIFPGSSDTILNITGNRYYNEIIEFFIYYLTTSNAIYIHDKLNRTYLGKKGEYRYHYNKAVVRNGNRYLMLFAHKLIAAARHGKNTMFTPSDVVKILSMFIIQPYMESIRRVYAK